MKLLAVQVPGIRDQGSGSSSDGWKAVHQATLTVRLGMKRGRLFTARLIRGSGTVAERRGKNNTTEADIVTVSLCSLQQNA